MEIDFNKIVPKKKEKKNQILSQINNGMNFLLHYHVFCNGLHCKCWSLAY
jgi:hypothetical protein